MSRALSLAIVVAMVAVSSAWADEKPVEIQLKEIWALRMEGTRDLRELYDDKTQESLIEPLLERIRKNWDNDHGLAVQGEGLDALREFDRIKKGNTKRNEVTTAGPVSIVFFTKLTGQYVRLLSVDKKNNRFTIRYRFVPHQTSDSSQYLAIIPLGKLQAGKYVVKVEQAPLEKKYKDAGFPETAAQRSQVCGSSKFEVVGK